MWKRLNNPKGARQPAYEQPNFDDRYAGSRGRGIDELPSPDSPIYKTDPPSRPPREDMEPKSLPQLPFGVVPPLDPRSSTLRPVSSIYSQSSPNRGVTRFPGNSYGAPAYTEEVSPPSSPELGSHRQRAQNQDDEVSPIDEMPDVLRLPFGRQSNGPISSSKPPSSSIPILRREKRRNQVAAAAANLVTRKDGAAEQRSRPTKNPSWDPYSGEPTTAERGKKQSTKPGEFTLPGGQSHGGLVMGNESIVTAGATTPKNHSSFGDRVRKLKTNNPPAERPEWRGASGRAALVTPVEDRFDIAPLNLPKKNIKRTASPQSPPVSSQGGRETDPASTHLSARDHPTTRNGLSENPWVQNSTNESEPHLIGSGLKTSSRGNLPTEPRAHESISPEEAKFRETFEGLGLSGSDRAEAYVQPPSRFSVTTYATSEAHSTHRISTDTFDRPTEPTPPMPTPPPQFTAQQPSLVLNRKRPLVGDGPRASVTRKAVNASSPVFISMSSKRTSTASNMAKMLPMSPAEAESHDLITSLQAQLENLSHRRINITKSIRQMTQLMPTDGVLITDEVRRKREAEKRKVEGLRQEEADVRREEHELGLKLHRAWKRKDKDAVYEPTGLWVRRVTG